MRLEERGSTKTKFLSQFWSRACKKVNVLMLCPMHESPIVYCLRERVMSVC